jgi:pimeloyl-ACP methyl ester carboxylesterase
MGHGWAPLEWPTVDIARRQVLRLLGMGLPAALVHGSTRLLAAQRADAAARSNTVQVNGVKLHYLEWGSERSPPMVLLHPAPLNAYVWDQFGAAMAPHFRVIAPDARGFGDSAWSSSYDGDVFLEDLHALMGSLGLKRPILCGNSMGGTLAYMYAGMHPDGVDRLIAVDTGPAEPPSTTPPTGAPPRRPGGPPPMSAGPFASAAEATAAIPPVMGAAFIKAMVDHNLRRATDGTWVWKHDHARVMAAGARSMTDPRKWPLWQAVRCPTLVLRGERSPALSQQAAERMVAGKENAVLEVIPGAGHFIPIEAPALFEAAVRRWLGV